MSCMYGEFCQFTIFVDKDNDIICIKIIIMHLGHQQLKNTTSIIYYSFGGMYINIKNVAIKIILSSIVHAIE